MRVEGNRVAVGGHEFRVLPEGAPEGQKLDHDTKDVTLPEGWAIVSRADPRFDVVKEKLIAAHGWSAYAVAVRRDAESAQGAKIFSTLWTKNAPAGQKAGSFVDDDASYAHSLGGGKFSMKEASARYLLHREAPPKPESSPAVVPPLSMSDEVWVDGNKVVAGAWEFRVAPEAAPGGSFIEHDTLPFDIPAGWQIASGADRDADVVKTRIIAAYNWSTYGCIVRKGAAGGEDGGKFSTLWTQLAAGAPTPLGAAIDPQVPGTVLDVDASYVKALDGERYEITEAAGRLLLRRPGRRPAPPAPLPTPLPTLAPTPAPTPKMRAASSAARTAADVQRSLDAQRTGASVHF